MKKIFMYTLLCLSFHAYANDAHLDKAVIEQQERIDREVKAGNLKEEDKVKLQQNQEQLKRDLSHARADGKLTPEERKALRDEIRENSKHFYNVKKIKAK